jgi:protein translocase SecG subunit
LSPFLTLAAPAAATSAPAAAVTPVAVTTAAAVPTAVAVPTPIPLPTAVQFHNGIPFGVKYGFITSSVEVLFLAATVAMILFMSIQTTKNEGLSGSIGGRAEAAYRGRLGLDQQLKRATEFTAWSWIVLAVCLLFLTR